LNYSTYKSGLLSSFKKYREKRFSQQDELFDERWNHVFKTRYAEYNLFDPELGKLLKKQRRHRWFRSMGSSQALAVSVFGSMIYRGDLQFLSKINDDRGHPLLLGFELHGKHDFDHPVKTLNEPKPTQVDLFLPGKDYRVAIECKLWEPDLGACSQVPKACNGCYSSQTGRMPGYRCALTEKGIKYWDYIPQLFHWLSDVDQPCPIWKPYQLVRNVLAASVDPINGEISGANVAVLIYDARNPAFSSGGNADKQFQCVQSALKNSISLKRTTWQMIAESIKEHGRYGKLLEWLDEKFGIHPIEGNALGGS